MWTSTKEAVRAGFLYIVWAIEKAIKASSFQTDRAPVQEAFGASPIEKAVGANPFYVERALTEEAVRAGPITEAWSWPLTRRLSEQLPTKEDVKPTIFRGCPYRGS